MAKVTPANGAKYLGAPPAVIDRVLARRKIDADGCWIWLGQIDRGYGVISFVLAGHPVHAYVHRLIYTHLVRDPGDEVQLDHLCHDPDTCVSGEACPHRRCFNPAHLEPVTQLENMRRSGWLASVNARKDSCDHGHEFTPENTRMYRGQRRCRECNRRYRREFLAKRRVGRTCQTCGADISDRSLSAKYCESCNPPTWRNGYRRSPDS